MIKWSFQFSIDKVKQKNIHGRRESLTKETKTIWYVVVQCEITLTLSFDNGKEERKSNMLEVLCVYVIIAYYYKTSKSENTSMVQPLVI